jgi:AraC family transcriptional activator of pobA
MHAEDQVAVFAAPCLLLVPAGVVHGFAWEVETTGSVLTLADSYLRDLMPRGSRTFRACSRSRAICP